MKKVILLRRSIQIIFLILFTWFFWQTRYHGDVTQPASSFFLRLDPLTALSAILAPTPTWVTYFLPALILLLATALLGRFFCGWICPMGTVIDISDRLGSKHFRRRGKFGSFAWKYYILGASLVAALFGAQLAWFFDPIPLLTRTFTVVVYPLAMAAWHFGIIHGRPVFSALGMRLYPPDAIPAFNLGIAAFIIFAFILGLTFISRRFWCRNLCPLGALLGFVGRFGLWRRTVNGCGNCTRCTVACKMGAIPDKGDCSHTLTTECIQCYDCLACPRPGVTRIGLVLNPETGVSSTCMGPDPSVQASRRYFLTALGAGVAYGVVNATGVIRPKAPDEHLIRPPGAIKRTATGFEQLSEKEFRDLCIRCGNCMKACLTSGLQPAVTEAGFDGVFTPLLVPRMGYCEQSCTACGDVCPTGALRPFTVKEKYRIPIGLAKINTDICLSWQTGKDYHLCLVCNEHCPYGAIRVIEENGERRPVVQSGKCVGCGQCEHACPAQPGVAIKVYRNSKILKT